MIADVMELLEPGTLALDAFLNPEPRAYTREEMKAVLEIKSAMDDAVKAALVPAMVDFASEPGDVQAAFYKTLCAYVQGNYKVAGMMHDVPMTKRWAGLKPLVRMFGGGYCFQLERAVTEDVIVHVWRVAD